MKEIIPNLRVYVTSCVFKINNDLIDLAMAYYFIGSLAMCLIKVQLMNTEKDKAFFSCNILSLIPTKKVQYCKKIAIYILMLRLDN